MTRSEPLVIVHLQFSNFHLVLQHPRSPPHVIIAIWWLQKLRVKTQDPGVRPGVTISFTGSHPNDTSRTSHGHRTPGMIMDEPEGLSPTDAWDEPAVLYCRGARKFCSSVSTRYGIWSGGIGLPCLCSLMNTEAALCPVPCARCHSPTTGIGVHKRRRQYATAKPRK